MGMMILKMKYHIFAGFRLVIYKLIFGKNFSVGRGTTFRRFFNVYLEKDAKIIIGKECFFNHGCSLNALDCIEIGEGCIFGENVKVYDHNHRFADLSDKIKNQGFSKAPVKIGKNCWFGSNVVILKGAEIGDNCVIGAGCIVDCKIPDNTLVKVQQELIQKEIIRR